MTTPGPTTLPVTGTGLAGRTLALTFDDGPHPVSTPALLDVLHRHGVRAVFCLWGDHVRAHPEIVRRIVAAGHVLGNHSMHHDDLSAWSPDRVRADLLEAAAAVEDAAPGVAVPYFRAPFGAWGASPGVAVQLGMQPLGWSLDVEDWDPPPPADVLLQRLADGVTPGGVVLLHDGGGDRSGTVEAVDRLVPRLLAGGWELTLPSPGGGPVGEASPGARGDQA
jgi:peptidoglycan/xylan/chitin deacetylase (PgdA/CDA1 family)